MKPRLPEFITNTYTDSHEVIRDVGYFISGLGVSFAFLGMYSDEPFTLGVSTFVAGIGIVLVSRESSTTDAQERVIQRQIQSWDIDTDLKIMLEKDKNTNDDTNGSAI